ncbi:MAG: regulatory protein RecX [Bacteroidales bacterium]
MTEESEHRTALKKAMAICAGQECCSGDIRAKLELWGLKGPGADDIIAILISEKFIDDSRYAAAFVKDRFNFYKWGKVKIASHLRMKRIPEETIGAALEELDDELYRKAVREIMSDHRRTIKAKNQYDLKAKMMRFGLSKGFESNLLYDILNETD